MFKIEHMGSLIQNTIYSSNESDIIELDKLEFMKVRVIGINIREAMEEDFEQIMAYKKIISDKTENLTFEETVLVL